MHIQVSIVAKREITLTERFPARIVIQRIHRVYLNTAARHGKGVIAANLQTGFG
jgi:hypothetical protein